MSINVRTDVASEALRIAAGAAGKVSSLEGVRAAEETLHGFSVTSVEIFDETGAKALSKPIGKYFTLHLPDFTDRGGSGFPAAAQTVAELIRRCLPAKFDSALIAALGNPDITPDALGSLTAAYTIVTRHLKGAPGFDCFRSAAVCRTGVLGTTGIESAAQIKLLAQALRPDCLIAVDALAGADAARLCRSVQICDSGIAPGSGVGNDREPLCRGTLGIPVIAVGVPTVIDAAVFGVDGTEGLFVTPRNIDSVVRRAGRLIAYGVNLALHDGLTVADIDMLVG